MLAIKKIVILMVNWQESSLSINANVRFRLKGDKSSNQQKISKIPLFVTTLCYVKT